MNEEKTGVIYKIEAKCPVAKLSGRAIYVGQTTKLERRWKEHRKKYPTDQYDYEVLLECDAEYLNLFERAFIQGYDSHRRGLNSTIGGTSIKSTHPDEETREKTSEALKGRPRADEVREKISASLKGKKKQPRSDETRAKISASQKGKKRRPHSEEARIKLSASSSRQVECPHCSKIGGITAVIRWHFDNCKNKIGGDR